MGYTGAKAARFKVDFINEFNKREDMLKSDDYILMRSQQILHGKMKALESELYQHKEIIDIHYEKKDVNVIDALNNVLSKGISVMEKQIELSYQQSELIKKEIERMNKEVERLNNLNKVK